MSDALREINEIFGYEYFERERIEQISENFLMFMPLVEGLLKETRGVTFEEIEEEAYDYERLKRVALQGLFDGNILKGYKGNTFEEKFNNYLYTSGIERCKWITKTGYRIYYQTFCNHISKLNSDRDAISLINEFVKEGGKSTTQALTKILVKSKFFEDSPG